MDSSQLHLTATDNELIILCHNESCKLLSGNPTSNRIVQISTVAIIKFGVGVTVEEFANQRTARQRLNPAIVQVPQAYRYMQRDSMGYIVMEFVRGKQLDVDDVANYATRLNEILAHFSEHQGEIPGPFNGGRIRGLIWPDSEDITFDNLQDLETWLNTKLGQDGERIVLQHFGLVICHMDFVGRNILILQNGSLCVLDWAHAGYYPQFFERLNWDFAPSDTAFCTALARNCPALSPSERRITNLVVRACSNSQFCYL
jgi:hypothetical protein